MLCRLCGEPITAPREPNPEVAQIMYYEGCCAKDAQAMIDPKPLRELDVAVYRLRRYAVFRLDRLDHVGAHPAAVRDR